MKQVRLKSNLIVPDGPSKSNFLRSGTVVDIAELPEKFRTPEYVEDVDAWRKGKVMLLKDLWFSQPLIDPTDAAIRTNVPCELRAGSLVRLRELPRSQRESMREGVDYATEFTEEQQRKLQERSGIEVVVNTNDDGFPSAEQLGAFTRGRY